MSGTDAPMDLRGNDRPAPARETGGPDPERERAARAAWSALSEPGDEVAGALVAGVGAATALTWVRSVGRHGPDWALLGDLVHGLSAGARTRLGNRAALWASRWATLGASDGERLQLPPGLQVVIPTDPVWPAGLDDLGQTGPHCLWVRGELPTVRSHGTGPRGQHGPAAVALVGSRACTAYGRRLGADLAHGLATHGVLVVSGGAFGIDAAAHRGTLAAGGRTAVVLAGGIDQPYPAAHRELFEDVVSAGGALLGEAAPGAAPLRSRFLQRNRLIAAMAGATVVVEAAWRSGALSTAHHAAQLLRPVGAVPGPVTSAASAGCHRLLREGCAVCVTDAAEVLELIGPLADVEADRVGSSRPLDAVDPASRTVHETLSLRRPAEPEDVAARCGLEIATVRASLGRLELAGLAIRSAEGWRARRA